MQGTTISRESYTPHQAPKPPREDLVTKYVKYGRSQALPTDNLSTFASMNQLAYPDPRKQQPGQEQRRVDSLMWAGTKFVDR